MFNRLRKSYGLSLVLVAALIFVTLPMVGCGEDGPSRKEVEQLAVAGRAVKATIDLNFSLPDDLLQAKVIKEDVYVKVKEVWNQVDLGIVSFNRGMAEALAAEKPNYKVLLKALAPVVADVVGNIRTLRSLVNAEKVQQVLAAVQISLMVIGTYFAVQISKARSFGLSDEQICAWVGLPYDKRRFELLANGV